MQDEVVAEQVRALADVSQSGEEGRQIGLGDHLGELCFGDVGVLRLELRGHVRTVGRAVALSTTMRASLAELFAAGRTLLADGATGTNYFERGLGAGDPPEFWNTDHPDKVRTLHQQFVDAGADIILTNTFGCNRHRLKLHNAEGRVYDLAKRAAELACEVADACPRPVVVAGSIGPTGELFEPLGALTEAAAVESFGELAAGLKAGGADVAWIETMSAAEEIRAAATAADGSRIAVHRNVFVRHRWAHDDGVVARRPGARLRRARRRRWRSAPTVALAPATRWSPCSP